VLRDRHDVSADLAAALALAVEALGSVGGENGTTRELGVGQLEVAVLDRTRNGRAFRRLAGAALTGLLEGGKDVPEKEVGEAGDAAPPQPGEDKPTVSAAPVDLEGKAPKTEGVSGDGDATGDAVNGDGS
jgi:proteasome alpha subunit